MKKTISSFIALAAAAIAAQGAVVDFTYNLAGDVPSRFGYDKLETVNVAIRINEPALVGSKITGISVPVYVDMDATKIGQCSAFITTELKVANKKNDANVCTEDATLGADGTLTCTFSEPYTITDAGVYVGYTIPVEEISASLGCKPVSVVAGNNSDGLYIYASRSVLRWTAKSADLGAVSAMTVSLEGDFSANAAGISMNPTSWGVAGEKTDVSVKFSNYGSTPLSSVDYSWKVGSASGTGVKTFEPAIGATFGTYVYSNIQIDAPAQNGVYSLEVTVNKANGVDCTPSTATSSMTIAPFVPVNRPLVEEFTGLWCGWCPRGYAALEQMNHEEPDRFVALAYHNADPMATIEAYPMAVSGYPYAGINRKGMDPGNIPSTWGSYAEKDVNSVVDVKLSWADEAHTVLRSTTRVRFTEAQDGAKYRFGACLIEDGMTDPTWEQSNSYAKTGEDSNPWLNIFTSASGAVAGLPFNDVVIAFPNSLGVGNVMPDHVDAYGEVTYVEDFDLNAVRSIYAMRDNLIQDVNKLKVVGILFDAAGKPLNCAKSDYATDGGELDPVYVDSPQILSVNAPGNGQPATISFRCPNQFDGKVKLNKRLLCFSIYVNGEIYTFEPSKYHGIKTQTDKISYGYYDETDPKNFLFAENDAEKDDDDVQTVTIYADDIKTIGVKTLYIPNKLMSYESRIVTVDANGEIDSIVTVDTAGASVRSEAYFDLQGRQIAAPKAGQIVIRRVVGADGSVRSYKERF